LKNSPTFFASRAAFRKWLAANHASVPELWIGFWKKASGKTGLTYLEAVEESLCYGWIDGHVQRLDDLAYQQRFTPRRPRSIWSLINVRRVEKLVEAGLMASPGLEAFSARDPKRSGLYSFENRPAAFSPAQEKRFRAKKRAFAFFEAQPPGYRRVATHWVTSARQEATRVRRLDRLMELCARGERLPHLTGNGVKPKA